jgi:hypothetical protein
VTVVGTEVALTGGSKTLSADGLVVTVGLLDNDLNKIKADAGLAIDKETTFLRLTSAFVTDTSNQLVDAITLNAAQQAFAYSGDTEKPTLSTFDLNMNDGTVTLVFVESMDPTTLKVEQVTLQKSSNAGIAEAHTISASDVTTAVAGVEIVVKLNIVDLNEMKAKGIGLTKEASYLTMTADAVKDMADKGIEALESGVNAHPADTHTSDSTDAKLAQFDLSIDAGILTLRFSEAVQSSTFEATEIILQNGNEVSQDCPCSQCLDNEFLVATCTADIDTSCTRCAECSVGQYESSSCSTVTGETPGQNSVCTDCETCDAGKYLQTHCSGVTATECGTCEANCVTCTGGGSMCLTCQDTFVLQDGLCVSACDDGLYDESGVCQPCDASCKTCSGSAETDCLTCESPFTKDQDGACAHTCNTDFTFEDASGACSDAGCAVECTNCFGPSSSA